MSIIDPVKIGNMALSNCGISSTIESFDENSIEAKQIKLWYDFARMQALAALDWNFARKRLTLTTDVDAAPTAEWNFRYQYPVDCLALRRLVNPVSKSADAVPFTVETNVGATAKTILSDLDSATAVYTFDLTDTGLFSSVFVNALSFLLAHQIAFALTGKRSVQTDNMQKYFATLRFAASFNKMETIEPAPRETEWIRGRE